VCVLSSGCGGDVDVSNSEAFLSCSSALLLYVMGDERLPSVNQECQDTVL
jgi:hypothetical protein